VYVNQRTPPILNQTCCPCPDPDRLHVLLLRLRLRLLLLLLLLLLLEASGTFQAKLCSVVSNLK
jgi:hypothetical protein